jgi:hypothetical protein
MITMDVKIIVNISESIGGGWGVEKKEKKKLHNLLISVGNYRKLPLITLTQMYNIYYTQSFKKNLYVSHSLYILISMFTIFLHIPQ